MSDKIQYIEAGYVPRGMALVHRYDVPVYEWDDGEYISYYSERYSEVYESGKLAPITCFEEGILLGDGESTWGGDEYGYFTIRNDGGVAIIEPDH